MYVYVVIIIHLFCYFGCKLHFELFLDYSVFIMFI